MAGRDTNPGELTFNDLNDHVRYLSRPERGIVGSPDTLNGILNVSGTKIIGEEKVTCPVLWLSISGRTSAWGRYMPMGNERCHILYRNDGTPVFHSYDATTTKDGRPGWEELTKGQQDGVSGWSTFRQLKRGEFDFKSSGNAYIFGSNTGTLLLSGGQAYIKLDNQAYRLEAKAAEFHQTSGASQSRFGIVYRKALPTDLAETPVPPSTFQEFLIDLNNANPATGTPINPLQSKAKLHFGDILDSFGVPVVSTKLPGLLRGIISLGDAASALEAFRLEIDQLGNVAWTQGAAGILGLNMRAQALDMEAILAARFNGATVTLGKVGATEPLVCGNLLINALTQFINNVFIANTAAWGVGNLGAPVPLSPAVVTALNTWLGSFVSNQFFNSTKAFTEKA